MASFPVKMMAGSPPESIGSNTLKPSTHLPLQVRVKEVEKLETSEKKSLSISRRDLALFLTAASFSLSSPKPAEARISKTEMKKMILEKLKILREKVGLSKPETEENEKIASSDLLKADKEISPPAPWKEEEKSAIPPLPSIQNDKKIAVEAAATLP
ncbi:hypothetical protein QVD17_03463 [Tagetes erecta]|uniref:Uncharacterized protein n=1 Tax=Tagetes erecta TaxID=13708 RepID=A0AAD8LFS0_TARER|nr:hypothetical protein QVD17_03463 [Tagetes erecta]